MLTRRSADAFVGRDRELAALRTEFELVQLGEPRVVLIEGPPGIGKSALVDHFLGDHTDLTTLRATGEQWEAFVAYGVVDHEFSKLRPQAIGAEFRLSAPHKRAASQGFRGSFCRAIRPHRLG